ncbi:MAG TPA: multidrug effflux MFS transporter [Chitinophagales bacterium]|nr:multidrug effflux MFS transporter [Chitinophagales bacterium]
MTQSVINRKFLIILLGILAALGPFSIDMYLPGFQQIAGEFNVHEKAVAFTLTSYFSGIAVGQLLYGPIVDKYGRKIPLLVGLSIYMLASLGCALASSIEFLIAMRLLQALGGCVGMVASNAIISDVYEKNERAKAFSYIILIMGLAPLIAPSLGSFFVAHFTWHYIFYFLFIFSLSVILLISFFLPETSIYKHSNKLKFIKISKDYLEVLKNPIFLKYTLASSIVMSILFAYISSAPFLFMTLYKLDNTTFSILFAVNAAGFIAGSYCNGVLTKYIPYIKIAKVASVILASIALAATITYYINPQIPYKILTSGIFFILVLIGFINPNATAGSLAPFTNNIGIASALGGSFRMGIGAIVAAFIGSFQGSTAIILFVIIFILSIATVSLLWIKTKKINH